MRSFLPAFELRRAASIGEAVALLAAEPGAWRPFAGGTDLMVQLEAGHLPHRRYVSLWGIGELRGIHAEAGAVTLGGLTTYTDVRRHPVLQAEFPLLVRAAEETGGVATQNRGTIGGNIANASPAADTPPALLVYDAALDLVSVRGTRTVPYRAFHTGYKTMDLAADEIVARVRLPRGRQGWVETYTKVGPRRAQAISKVCFAAAAQLDGAIVRDIRLALGSVAPTVVRAARTEEALRGGPLTADAVRAAVAALASEIAPIDDIRSTARYRARVAGNLLTAFLETLARRR